MSEFRRVFFRIIDLACILLALEISSLMMLPPDWTILDDYTGASTFTLVIFFLTFYMLDCYNVGHEDLRDSLLRVFMAVVIGIVASGFVFYSFEHWRFPKLIFLVLMLITLALTMSWRVLYFYFDLRRGRAQRVIFIGADKVGRARTLLAKFMPRVEIAGYLGEPGEDEKIAGPWLGGYADTLEVVKNTGANRVFLLADSLDPQLARDLFNAKLQGLWVEDMRGMYERLARRVPVDLIHEDWLLMEDGFNLNVSLFFRRAKRAFDIAFALCLGSAALPVLLLTAVAVRLESRGPVIYRQKRVGLHEKEFTVYKVRSMRVDAEKNGAVWAAKNDPRVTRVGAFIRKTRIDELPQLWNVLKGEMSVVGPRPERPEFVRDLVKVIPFYERRHLTPPGLTGWAQLCYHYGASVEDAKRKLQFDLYYLKHLSLQFDLKIILKTLPMIARGSR